MKQLKRQARQRQEDVEGRGFCRMQRRRKGRIRADLLLTILCMAVLGAARIAAATALTAATATMHDLCFRFPVLCECERFPDATVMLYNRVPKCGSETVVAVFEAMLGKHVTVCTDSHTLERSIRRDALPAFAHDPLKYTCHKKRKKGQRYIVHKHTFHVPLKREEDVYFNVIRDPVTRCESRFYYEKARKRIPAGLKLADCLESGDCLLPHGLSSAQYSELRKPKMRALAAKYGERYAERLHLVAEECATNYQTRWIGGVQPTNWNASMGEMFIKAERVMVDDYPLIGLTERLPDTLWLANVIYPGMFGNKVHDRAYFDKLPCENCNPQWEFIYKLFGWKEPRVAKSRPVLSDAHRELLQRVNQFDIRLHGFASQVLDEKLKACQQLRIDQVPS